MVPIQSGSTTERVVRTSIVTVLAIFGAAYCFYDGYVGYPRENLKRAIKDLSPPPAETPRMVTELDEQAVQGIERGTELAELQKRWGEPGWRNQDEVRYFGPEGQLVITLRDDHVLRSEYQPARYKTALDLRVQKIMGLSVGIAALVLIVRWFRVVFGRTTLTEQGVKTTGSPFVSFESMTGLRAEQFAKKGWVDVEYTMNGRAGAMRLDDYKAKAFPAIIEEICRRKGYENPHAKWIAEKSSGVSPQGPPNPNPPTG